MNTYSRRLTKIQHSVKVCKKDKKKTFVKLDFHGDHIILAIVAETFIKFGVVLKLCYYILFTYSRRTKGREVGCVDQTFHGPFQGEGQKIN